MQLGNNYRAIFTYSEAAPDQPHKKTRRLTTCTIKDPHDNVIAEQTASCNHKDLYSKKIGRKAAFTKAMKYLYEREIPSDENSPRRMDRAGRTALWNGFKTLPGGRTRFGKIEVAEQPVASPA